MRMKKKWKFKLFLLIYSILWCIGIIIGLNLLWDFLDDYENSMPVHVMEENLPMFGEEECETLLHMDGLIEPSKFETKEMIKNIYINSIHGKSISFEKKAGEYSDEHPVYLIKADQDDLAVVTLKKRKGKSHFGFTRWEFGTVSNFMSASHEVIISVPSNASISLNGIPVGDEYIVSKDNGVETLDHVIGLAGEIPFMVTYRISGLYESQIEPEVKGFDGTLLTAVAKEDGSLVCDFSSPQVLISESTPRILAWIETYGRYITNDGEFEELEPYLLKGSPAYQSLKSVVTDWFTDHDSVEYKNQKAENFKSYNETCFSCEVSFDQIIHRNGEEYVYSSNLLLIFIKDNGQWLLSDMSIQAE